MKCSSLPLQLNIKNPTSHWQRIHKDMEQTASQNLEGNTEENKPGCGNEPADFTAHSRASSFLPSLQGMHLLPAWGVHKMMFILSPFLATFNLTFSSLRLHLYQHLLQSNIYTSDSISRYHLDGGTGFHPGASSILGKKANPELQPQPFFKFFIFSLYSPGWLWTHNALVSASRVPGITALYNEEHHIVLLLIKLISVNTIISSS